MRSETIAAIATAMTNSGIGIVRISGDDALPVADKIFRPFKGNKKVSEMDSHTLHYGHIYDGDMVIDEVMLLIMKAPNSYTREDTIEIDCHGGILVMQRILETVLKYGARPAEPGEFTKRAFLNGRIDLTQAESVIDVINAKNDMALKSSVSQLQGSVSNKIKEIRAKVIHEIAFIESALDDPEHVDLTGYPENLNLIVKDVLKDVNDLIASADNGKVMKEGINTVIVGKPNAGKSSLLNILVGQERAIVTDIAGTTRDILEEHINLNGISLNMIDTAGIRDTEDIVEKIGVTKSREYMEQADLVIYVVDASTSLDENDRQIIEAIRNKKCIVLMNKSDLEQCVDKEELRQLTDHPILSVSALEQTGIRDLEDKIKDMFFHGEVSFNEEVYITNIRHKNALTEAGTNLSMVLQSIENGMPEDFFSIDLMSAYENLGSIIGESAGEDLINEIFSKFCMGK